MTKFLSKGVDKSTQHFPSVLKIYCLGYMVEKLMKKEKVYVFISCFPVGYQEISVKIFFDLTLVPPAKTQIFLILLPSLIAPHNQMEI